MATLVQHGSVLPDDVTADAAENPPAADDFEEEAKCKSYAI